MGRGDGVGTLASGNGLLMVSRYPEVVGQSSADQPQTSLIIQGLGERLGSAQVVADLAKCCQWRKLSIEVEPEIDGLLDRVTALGEVG